jgi:putative endonuclease
VRRVRRDARIVLGADTASKHNQDQHHAVGGLLWGGTQMSYLRRAQNNKPRGDQAENLALEFLQERGLTLVKRNHRCRMGEVDLIMQDGGVTVFVEVRLRTSSAFVAAGESVDARKQRRIIAAAQHYLIGHPDAPCRFDCVLFARLDAAAVEWVKDAFSAG